MKANLIGLLVLSLMLMTNPVATAATTAIHSLKTKKPKVQKEKPFARGFGLGIVYSLSQDLAEQAKPRRSNNRLSAEASYRVDPNFSLGSSVSLNYVTLGGKTQEQPTGGYGKVSADYDLGGSYKTSVFGNNEFRTGLGVSIPTDEESRFEGVQGIPYFSAGLSTPLFTEKVVFDNSFSYIYILNHYDTSVSGESNPEASISYTTGIRWKVGAGFSIGAGAGIKTTRYLDDFVSYSYNNSQSIAYSRGGFTTSLGHVNGGFTDKGEVNLWYVDKYRRLVSWKVGYDF